MHSLRKIVAATTALVVLLPAASAWAADGIGPFERSVRSANPAQGAPPNVISRDFYTGSVLATGDDLLENPSGTIVQFGHLSDGSNTEPDQNLYMNIDSRVTGPTRNYDYGHHFLFQGHEGGGDLAYVTRINLDVADPAHRITLLTPVGQDGLTHFNSLDGSAYDPFTNSMFFTQEGSGTTGGLIEISSSFPAKTITHYGDIGRCGLEGVHTDDKGRIYLVEDTGGPAVSNDKHDINGSNKVAKQPNSYVFRFVPNQSNDLSRGGRLEALQVSVDGQPLVFGGTTDQQAFDDVWSQKQVELHSGTSFPTQWVTVHDTANGMAEFNCNLAARAAGATPFKRPENGVFKPDGSFRTFFFVTTGDTNSLSGSVNGLAKRGAWGGIFQLDLDSDQANGMLKLIVLGDKKHNSFDNVTFGDSGTLLVAEDRGDTLHDQLNTLDSAWAYHLSDLSSPLRLIALGRDQSASGDGAEDNEPTGLFVSNGAQGASQQYGTPSNLMGARGFFTKQHGDNTIYELNHR